MRCIDAYNRSLLLWFPTPPPPPMSNQPPCYWTTLLVTMVFIGPKGVPQITQSRTHNLPLVPDFLHTGLLPTPQVCFAEPIGVGAHTAMTLEVQAGTGGDRATVAFHARCPQANVPEQNEKSDAKKVAWAQTCFFFNFWECFSISAKFAFFRRVF